VALQDSSRGRRRVPYERLRGTTIVHALPAAPIAVARSRARTATGLRHCLRSCFILAWAGR